jgi:hypothetical protein
VDENRVEVQGSARRSVPADRVRWALVVTESRDVPADATLSVRPQHDEHGRRLAAVDSSRSRTPRLDGALAAGGRL